MAILLLALGALAQAQHYYPQMPDVVASHFDGRGVPNDHTSRNGFFVVAFVIYAWTVLFFLGIGPLLRRIPARWINMPHREYFLAPERRENSLRMLVARLEWFGVVTMLFFLATFKFAFDANLTSEARLDSVSMFLCLGVYFLFTAVWLVELLLKYRKPKPA